MWSPSSGKSSLVLLINRLLEPTAGVISLGPHSLSAIPRQLVRERVITLPQAPFFAEGATIRDALAHGNVSATEEVCELALQAVGLSDLDVSRGGLDAELDVSSMSHGQRQLLSLARAVVRVRSRPPASGPGGLLLLDEFNSAVDADTDRLMRDIVRREFAAYTVICVAHRLDGVVMEYDRVVVMDRGRIAEAGPPKELMKDPAGRFRELASAPPGEWGDAGQDQMAGEGL